MRSYPRRSLRASSKSKSRRYEASGKACLFFPLTSAYGTHLTGTIHVCWVRIFTFHYTLSDSHLTDYGIVQCTPIPGESLSSRKSIRSYVRRLQILALHDDQAGFVILKSAHGIGMPLDAFHPWLVCKILAHMLAYLYLQGEE